MTAADLAEVRTILRNLQAFGQPYPNFLMWESGKPYEAPEKHMPLGRLYLATVGGTTSFTFFCAWVSLSLFIFYPM